jgi:hypothetical protein
MLVISQNLVVSATDIPPGTPLIGWQNIVTAGNIVADTQDTDHPASNLANPATNLDWRASGGSPALSVQYISITTSTVELLDYVAIARHNLGSTQIPITIEGTDGALTGSPPALTWVVLVQETLLADDNPAVFQFTPRVLAGVRIRLGAGNGAARIAVAYCGKLLICERGLRVNTDFMAIHHGRKTTLLNGWSESGQFLGRVVVNEAVETIVGWQYFTPAWYRTNFQPFLDAAQDGPFFIVIDPVGRPAECGYCWLVDDPDPMTSPITRRINVDLKMRGIVA